MWPVNIRTTEQDKEHDESIYHVKYLHSGDFKKKKKKSPGRHDIKAGLLRLNRSSLGGKRGYRSESKGRSRILLFKGWFIDRPHHNHLHNFKLHPRSAEGDTTF